LFFIPRPNLNDNKRSKVKQKQFDEYTGDAYILALLRNHKTEIRPIYFLSMLPCLFKQITGVDCPGCGAQRSFDLLIHGQLIESFKLYPALVPLIILLISFLFDLFFKQKNKSNTTWYLAIFSMSMVIGSYIIKALFAQIG
jgi:hypothetical protein